MAKYMELIDFGYLSSDAIGVTISNIPTSVPYEDLIIFWWGNDASTSGHTYIRLRLNGDTGTNYEHIYHATENDSNWNNTGNQLVDNIWIGMAAQYNYDGSAFGRIYIPGYPNPNRYKQVMSNSVSFRDVNTSSTYNHINFSEAEYQSTTAISSVTIYGSANLKGGTTATGFSVAVYATKKYED